MSEFDLIAAIRERVAQAGAPDEVAGLVLASGDDAAISQRDAATATSVDALVEGVHFRIPPFELRSVGHKALAVALSDLAAMGAVAREAYVQLGIPVALGHEQLLELADGLGALAARHGVAVAGGDVTAAPALFVAMTVVGEALAGESLVTRAGAQPSDAIVITGELGGAAAGLILLNQPELAGRVEPKLGDELRRRQLEPQPRLAAGQALARAGASALIDLSDGLGADAGHVAAASGVALAIGLDSVAAQEGVAEIARAAKIDPARLIATGGEDYELLATIAPDRLERASELVSEAGSKLTVVGEVKSGVGCSLSRPDGTRVPAAGFDQMLGRQSPHGLA